MPNDKLKSRAGNNTPDKPGYHAFNGFFGARNAVALDHDSGDIEVIPSPPPGFVRVLDSISGGPSFGQVAELAATLAGHLIWQDAQGNENALETVSSATGQLQGTTPVASSVYQHLVYGERIIFRPAVAGAPGSGVFMGAWKDTDLDAMRGDLNTSLQIVAQPPAGKTWALAPSPLTSPFRALFFWNFDSVAHSVELFFYDGSNNIAIDSSMAAVAAFAAGPPPKREARTPRSSSKRALSSLTVAH